MSTTNMTPTTGPPSRRAPSRRGTVTAHYLEPDWFTRHIFNLWSRASPAWGSASGAPGSWSTGADHRRAAPRPGEPADHRREALPGLPPGPDPWVRNVRHAGGHLVLILGRRRELCTAREIPAADSVPVLRTYLPPLEVRDGHVLRRHDARLHRRRVGCRGRQPPGLRARLNLDAVANRRFRRIRYAASVGHHDPMSSLHGGVLRKTETLGTTPTLTRRSSATAR